MPIRYIVVTVVMMTLMAVSVLNALTFCAGVAASANDDSSAVTAEFRTMCILSIIVLTAPFVLMFLLVRAETREEKATTELEKWHLWAKEYLPQVMGLSTALSAADKAIARTTLAQCVDAAPYYPVQDQHKRMLGGGQTT